MKIRRSGTYTSSQSEEFLDPDTIAAHVSLLTGLDVVVSKVFVLSYFASFTTLRQTWIADKYFKLVLDQTDFDHTIGEVELEAQMDMQDGDEVQKAIRAMDNRITDFLQHYVWAFSAEIPIGKLSAYFERKAREKA